MPDPLTTDDMEAILRGGGSATDKLQRAARLGAERERERCLEAVSGAFPVAVTIGSPYARGYDDGVHAALGTIRKHAAAIRRGEGE